ncbi:pyridoxamine 5'-phosphate oxidase family protein [Halorientalis salina]|uniref:pyridoxamine 5'-phosphate oxidase family protein n=1 Tax=Halorientalis salina TaxID=2932266 RepID=UPI002022B707|nr:pyridoxamine 5'-phosphate oxidase family protein [Halorientalis salina]
MQEPWYGKTMGQHEIEEFLNEQATGVLSLSNDGRAYGIPVSFAFDDADGRAIMDLGFADDSKKRRFIETTEEVCLTVYDWESPTNWRSVIVTGVLTRVDDTDVADETRGWYYEVAKDIEIPEGDVELEWYELRADEISGVALYE